MTIVDLLNQNASLYADEVALVEINPCFEPESRLTWKDSDGTGCHDLSFLNVEL